MLALLKWKEHHNKLAINLRTDSQDAWIFEPPLHHSMLEKVSSFDFFKIKS